MSDWKSYQEEVADVFRALGCEVKTNYKCSGARDAHWLDVSVRFFQFGLSQHWIVECKYWKKRISKEKVFAFVKIAEEIGADRGLLVAEAGYQSGAYRRQSTRT